MIHLDKCSTTEPVVVVNSRRNVPLGTLFFKVSYSTRVPLQVFVHAPTYSTGNMLQLFDHTINYRRWYTARRIQHLSDTSNGTEYIECTMQNQYSPDTREISTIFFVSHFEWLRGHQMFHARYLSDTREVSTIICVWLFGWYSASTSNTVLVRGYWNVYREILSARSFEKHSQSGRSNSRNSKYRL